MEADNVSVRSSKGVAVAAVNDDDNSWTDVNLDEHREDLRPSQCQHFKWIRLTTVVKHSMI